MEISALKAFVAVASEGSFSNAAQQLYVTQPAISKRISSLESELDTRLFDRAGKQVLLTESGKTLLPHAQEIITKTERTRELMASLAGTVTGPLRIASSHHIGLHRLPEILKNYSRAYPDVELDLNFLDSEAACRQVEHGNLELALITLPTQLPGKLATKVIWHDPLRIVAAQETAGMAGYTEASRFLMETSAILPPKSTWTRQIIDQYLEERNITAHTMLETNNLETIRKMVEIGLGWSILPATMLSPALRVVTVDGMTPSRQLGIVHHRQRTLSNAASAMVNLLQQEEGVNTPSGKHQK